MREKPHRCGRGVRPPVAWRVRSCAAAVYGRRRFPRLDHLLPAQGGDRAGAESEIARQDGVGVLAERRWRRSDRTRRLRQLDRHTERPELTDRRVLDARDHLTRVELRIVEELLE